MEKRTKLTSGSSNFQEAMQNGFGIITVMDARVFEAPSVEELAHKTAYQVVASYAERTPICTLDTLKVANVSQEGPTKTITGGKYSNPLIKFGKSARLEIQDALGSARAIDALCGGVREWKGESKTTGLHFGEDFQGPKLIIGDTFVIDKNTGQQVPVNIVFYQFLPDSIFNLTQDAEGDATVFDMNGDLLTTLVRVGTQDPNLMTTHGVFYSIVDPNHNKLIYQTITLESAGSFGDTIVEISTNEDGSGKTYTITSPVMLSVEVVSGLNDEYNFTLKNGVRKTIITAPSDSQDYDINFLWNNNTITIEEQNASIPSDLKVLIGA